MKLLKNKPHPKEKKQNQPKKAFHFLFIMSFTMQS